MCECYEAKNALERPERVDVGVVDEPKSLILSELDKSYEHTVYLETVIDRLENRLNPVMGEPEPQIQITEDGTVKTTYYKRSPLAELIERNNNYLIDQSRRIELITDLLQL